MSLASVARIVGAVRGYFVAGSLLLGATGCVDVFIGLVAVSGAGIYVPGSFAAERATFSAQRATVGCIDLAITRRESSRVVGPVVEYTFGNRCDHRVPFDLVSLRVVARTPDGETALVANDPSGELRVLPLGARTVGVEGISYRVDTHGFVVSADAQICVDVSRVDASREAASHADSWLCTGGGS